MDASRSAGSPTTWIWEGVVAYLHRPAVTATVGVVSGLSAPGSNLIVNYQSPSVLAAVGRIVARAINASARRRSPWADEPRRSAWTPQAMRRLLTGHGFTVTSDDDLLGLARRCSSPVRHRASLGTGRIAVATCWRRRTPTRLLCGAAGRALRLMCGPWRTRYATGRS
jgi:O-methyltransferase involved in polyketide biosynthesis